MRWHKICCAAIVREFCLWHVRCDGQVNIKIDFINIRFVKMGKNIHLICKRSYKIIYEIDLSVHLLFSL